MIRWTLAVLALALVSVVGVQQLIKHLHYGSRDGWALTISSPFSSRALNISPDGLHCFKGNDQGFKSINRRH